MGEYLERYGRRVLLGGLTVVCLLMLCPAAALMQENILASPGIFPGIVLLLLAAAAAVILRFEKLNHAPLELFHADHLQLTGTLSLTAFYPLVVEKAGFFAATFVFIPACAFFLGAKTLYRPITASCLWCLVVYLVFVCFLNTPLPEGGFF